MLPPLSVYVDINVEVIPQLRLHEEGVPAFFQSLHAEGALLSVISLIRRSSVIVTFAVGAAMFKEKNIVRKSAILALMLAGVVLLMASSLQ